MTKKEERCETCGWSANLEKERWHFDHPIKWCDIHGEERANACDRYEKIDPKCHQIRMY